MSGIIFLLIGLGVGYLIGRVQSTTRAETVNTDLILAAFAVTLDSTYGVDFRSDLFEEVESAMGTETETIAKLAMHMNRLRETT